jgi:hypothetical protein
MRRILKASRWHLLAVLAFALVLAGPALPASAQTYPYGYGWPYGGWGWGWGTGFGSYYGVGSAYGSVSYFPYGYFDPYFGAYAYPGGAYLQSPTTPYGYYDPAYGPYVYGQGMGLDPCMGGINFYGLPIQCGSTSP